jgi:hypothetical protein
MVRALFLIYVILLLPGCSVSPSVTAESLTLGVVTATVLRRMLTDGTWPKRLTLKDPWKSLLAGAFGATASTLAAVLQGATWDVAIQVTIAGLPALLQGVFEVVLPRNSSDLSSAAEGTVGASGSGDGVDVSTSLKETTNQ